MEKLDFQPLTVTVTEEQRQLVLQALALIAVREPMTNPALEQLAEAFQGKTMFEQMFKQMLGHHQEAIRQALWGVSRPR